MAKAYPVSDNHYQYTTKNYNEILNLEKDDYGVYSRSANRALYFNRKKQVESEEDTKYSKEAKITAKFYKSYLGSYSQRKNILKTS